MSAELIIALIAVLISGISVGITILIFFNQNAVIKNQVFKDMIEKYSSEELRIALVEFMKLYNTCHKTYEAKKEANKTKEDFTTEFIYDYYRYYKAEREQTISPEKPMVFPYILSDGENIIQPFLNIEKYRRTISHFYILLAYLHDIDLITSKMIKKVWIQKNIDIIKEILLPIEAIAIKKVLYGEEVIERPTIEALIKLYNDSGEKKIYIEDIDKQYKNISIYINKNLT